MTTATRTTADEYLDGPLTRFRQLIDGVVVVNEPRLVHPGFAVALDRLFTLE